MKLNKIEIARSAGGRDWILYHKGRRVATGGHAAINRASEDLHQVTGDPVYIRRRVGRPVLVTPARTEGES